MSEDVHFQTKPVTTEFSALSFIYIHTYTQCVKQSCNTMLTIKFCYLYSQSWQGRIKYICTTISIFYVYFISHFVYVFIWLSVCMKQNNSLIWLLQMSTFAITFGPQRFSKFLSAKLSVRIDWLISRVKKQKIHIRCQLEEPIFNCPSSQKNYKRQ